MTDLDLNINGDARRARAALNDVASGSARAARITDQLSRSFDHLENEANDAQRALDRVQDEISDTGPTAELNAELARLQGRLSEIADERRVTENMRAQFRRATASAAQLDNQLADVRHELDRLNDEYSRGGDPAVLRRIQEQQRELQRLAGIRRRIAEEDENNQARLARLAEEARRAQQRRAEQDRRNDRSLGGRGRRLGDSLQGAPVPPSFLAAGAAIGASAAVPLLAALGGAVAALAGAGIAGAGIAGAIMGDPEKFKAEWAAAAGSIKKDFLGATEVFAGPTLDAIRSIGPLVESWNIDEIFADASQFVRPLVGGIEDFASGVVRGTAALVSKAGPAVEALSAGMSELGDAAGDAMESIAEGAEGGAEALRDVIFAGADVIRVFGEITGAAGKAYQFIHEHPILAAFSTAGLSLPITLLDQFSDGAHGAFREIDDAATVAAESVKDAWEGAAAAMQDYEDTLHHLYDAQMGLVSSSVAWEQAVDDLDESLKENGKNWDISTQKGRDNTEQLQSAIDKALAHRDAMIEDGQSVADANAWLDQQIAYLEGVAGKAGLSKERFDQMTGALKNWMNQNATKTIKTIHIIEYQYVSKEGRIGDGSDPRTKVGGAYAGGGDVTGTGPMLVGEMGPEIVWGDKGQYVSTAEQTRRMMSAMTQSAAAGGSSASGGLTMRIVGDNSWLMQAVAAGIDSGQIQIFDSNGQQVRTRL